MWSDLPSVSNVQVRGALFYRAVASTPGRKPKHSPRDRELLAVTKQNEIFTTAAADELEIAASNAA